jgi:hypothetical protein
VDIFGEVKAEVVAVISMLPMQHMPEGVASHGW